MGWVRVDATSSGWASPFTYGEPLEYHLSIVLLSFLHAFKTTIDLYGDGSETNNGLIKTDYRPFRVWKHYAIRWDGTNVIAYMNGVLTYQGTATPLTELTDFFIGVRF